MSLREKIESVLPCGIHVIGIQGSSPEKSRKVADPLGHKEIVLCEAILKSHLEERWVDVIRS